MNTEKIVKCYVPENPKNFLKYLRLKLIETIKFDFELSKRLKLF